MSRIVDLILPAAAQIDTCVLRPVPGATDIDNGST
jgi:hypothetical protein